MTQRRALSIRYKEREKLLLLFYAKPEEVNKVRKRKREKERICLL